MIAELDKKDILKSIESDFLNDVEVLYEFIDKGTNNWDSFRELTERMLSELVRNGEFDQLYGFISQKINQK